MITRLLLLSLLFFQAPTFATITVNDKAPHIDLALLEGEKAGKLVGINDYKGKLIYLDFWASWCAPCRQSFPFLKALKTEYAAQGFEVVSVNVDSSVELALEFLKRHPVNHPILLDHAGKMSQAYHVQGLPVAFIINREGMVVYKHLGFKEADKPLLTRVIRQQLNLE